MSEDEKKEKCIEIIEIFLKEELNIELNKTPNIDIALDTLFKYCLIKSAYSKSEWDNIIYNSQNFKYFKENGYKENRKENEFPELIIKYCEWFFYNREKFNEIEDILKMLSQKNDIRNEKINEDKRGDADNSQLAYAIYYLLWKESLPEGIKINIEIKNNKIEKIFFKINCSDNEINCGGDTLNTRDTICSCNNSKLEDNFKNKDELKEMIDCAEDFRWNYETLGNFMPMPIIKDYRLNTIRKNVLGDQFDLYLKSVQKFYRNNFKPYNQDLFCEALEKNKEYFEAFGKGDEGFANYLNANYLTDYFDKNKKEVIDLFKRKDYQVLPLPQNNEQKDYMENAQKIIEKRAKTMQEGLCNILKEYYNTKNDQ